MRWHLGCDHAGWALKSHLAGILVSQGHEVVDHGTDGPSRVDYPDFAARAARALLADSTGSSARGLLVCGTGVGISIAANRFPGIRAAVAAFEGQAALARAHNDANVLCLGERFTAPMLAERILHTFIDTAFDGGRHLPRVQKLDLVGQP